MTEPTVTIPQSRYEDLLDTEEKLLALENAGVDNWNGYDYALEEYWSERTE